LSSGESYYFKREMKNEYRVDSDALPITQEVGSPYFNHHPKFDIEEDVILVAAKAVGHILCSCFDINNEVLKKPIYLCANRFLI